MTKTLPRGLMIMAAIQRSKAAVAKEKSVQYVYWNDGHFRVIKFLGDGTLEISLGFVRGKEKTKIVPENETTTAPLWTARSEMADLKLPGVY